VLAGIAGLKDTLEDRALTSGDAAAAEGRGGGAARPGDGREAQGLRDQCALACLARIGDIIDAHELAAPALEREGIDDRRWICGRRCWPSRSWPTRRTPGTGARTSWTRRRTWQRFGDADAEAGTAARLLEALRVIREREGEALTPTDLLEALRARPGWDWVKAPGGWRGS
jgi:hypothetical protein